MKDIFKLSAILCLVTVIAAAALSSVNSITKPKIEQQRALDAEKALTVAVPGAAKDAFVAVTRSEQILYYRAYSSNDKNNLIGYAVVASADGYQSTIETMVGVDTAFVISGMQIYRQAETPGLGTKIIEVREGEAMPWFQKQFIGKTSNGLAVVQDDGEIVSVIGATISSRAVTNSIASTVDSLKIWVKEYK